MQNYEQTKSFVLKKNAVVQVSTLTEMLASVRRGKLEETGARENMREQARDCERESE